MVDLGDTDAPEPAVEPKCPDEKTANKISEEMDDLAVHLHFTPPPGLITWDAKK